MIPRAKVTAGPDCVNDGRYRLALTGRTATVEALT